MPLWWGRNQSGMQAREELDAGRPRAGPGRVAARARRRARHAERLAAADINLHKQLVNRILEPFAWITVIITRDRVGELLHPAHPPRRAARAQAHRRADARGVPGERAAPARAGRVAHAADPARRGRRRCRPSCAARSRSRAAPASRTSRTTARATTPRISSSTSGCSAAARTGTGRPSSTSPRRWPTRPAGRATSAAGSSSASASRTSTADAFGAAAAEPALS